MRDDDEIRAVLRDTLADLTSYYAAQLSDLGADVEATWNEQLYTRLQQLTPDESDRAIVLLLAPDARSHARDIVHRANRPTDHAIRQATNGARA